MKTPNFIIIKEKKIDLPISKTRLVIFLEEDQEYEKAIEKDYVITRKFINRFLYKTHFEGKKQLQRNDLMLTNKKVVRL